MIDCFQGEAAKLGWMLVFRVLGYEFCSTISERAASEVLQKGDCKKEGVREHNREMRWRNQAWKTNLTNWSKNSGGCQTHNTESWLWWPNKRETVISDLKKALIACKNRLTICGYALNISSSTLKQLGGKIDISENYLRKTVDKRKTVLTILFCV